MGAFSLLLFVCSFGNTNGCTQTANAYYLTTPLPGYVERIRKEESTLAYSAIFLTSIYEKKASLGIGYNLTTSLDLNQGTAVPYIRWSYKF
jgi:hypothetical protein